VLDGGTGANTLQDGGFSGVTLIGDGGNDTFVVSNATTNVFEMPNNGSVTVATNLCSYVLPSNVEKLVYTGTSGINATGNGLNDTFSGFTGASTVTGGTGTDTFVFAPVNPTTTNGVYKAGFGQDVIADFRADTTNANHDILTLSSSMFAAGTTADSLAGGTAHNAAGGAVSVAQSGSNVVITVDPTDTITLNNVALSVLKAGAATDIHFA
jgi:Ca2+-binding RTX toxin-like protein